jgi:hypothetical protein
VAADTKTAREVARLVRDGLEQGRRVEIERLGTFRRARSGRFEFLPEDRASVFLAYVEEDREIASRLYDLLDQSGFSPWMDSRRLLAGQNWPRAIQRAIGMSDFFVACLSNRAVGKRGWFQSELRYALDCARKVPFDDVFFVPVRLDDCRVPARIQQQIQYIDLFPDAGAGATRLVSVLREELSRRRER